MASESSKSSKSPKPKSVSSEVKAQPAFIVAPSGLTYPGAKDQAVSQVNNFRSVTEGLSTLTSRGGELHDAITNLFEELGYLLDPTIAAMSISPMQDVSDKSAVVGALVTHADSITEAVTRLRHLRDSLTLNPRSV